MFDSDQILFCSNYYSGDVYLQAFKWFSCGDQELEILHSNAYPFVDRIRILSKLTDERQQSKTKQKNPGCWRGFSSLTTIRVMRHRWKTQKTGKLHGFKKIHLRRGLFSRLNSAVSEERDVMHEEREHQRIFFQIDTFQWVALYIFSTDKTEIYKIVLPQFWYLIISY